MLGGATYTFAADTYSLGLVLSDMSSPYKVANHCLPFKFDMNADDVLNALSHGERPLSFVGLARNFARYAKIISDCLSMHPENRPSLEDVKQQLKGLISSDT